MGDAPALISAMVNLSPDRTATVRQGLRPRRSGRAGKGRACRRWLRRPVGIDQQIIERGQEGALPCPPHLVCPFCQKVGKMRALFVRGIRATAWSPGQAGGGVYRVGWGPTPSAGPGRHGAAGDGRKVPPGGGIPSLREWSVLFHQGTAPAPVPQLQHDSLLISTYEELRPNASRLNECGSRRIHRRSVRTSAEGTNGFGTSANVVLPR